MNAAPRRPRAVVFAYHNVGVRCLRVLLAHDVDVRLVVTHEDRPDETIWFDSVADTARECELDVAAPADPNAPEFAARVQALAPDFIFSFYYRSMLGAPLLEAAARGAYNMHGSLLPKYRGRVPVNWAVIRGERETGATLHRMVAKPDAGAIVAQEAVPILPDDTAAEVFAKVTVAAEIALDRVLPKLVAGTAEHREQDLAAGSYFGGRTPADGRIDWSLDAQSIHNLVRGVAPPYPGAFTTVAGRPARVLRTRLLAEAAPRSPALGIYVDGARLAADCGRGVLQILRLEIDGAPIDAAAFVARFGAGKIPLE
ncbi:MAG: formyltransferase [Burkholderiaceae bacterium]